MNVNGDMNVHPSTAAYRALKVCALARFGFTALSNAVHYVYECVVIYKNLIFTRILFNNGGSSIKTSFSSDIGCYSLTKMINVLLKCYSSHE
ncbi:hypothetical protein SAMN05421813_10685 [Daejeonella rubra]|uniref:Uncharacterized protein n=1 Tax=Daejeonella rubra TaxID=990371 RepID=A0A1G9QKM9_9SPHI|nr:hypothetical protein SAMN05421813_10685 [Daejeonella rubra]